MLLTDTTQLTKTFSCTRLEVQALPVIPDGKVLCMTVNGILQDVKPGIYTGKVTVYLLDAMTEDIAAEIRPEGGPGAPGAPDGLKMMGPPDGMSPPPDQHIYVNYISALTIDETGPIPEQSAAAAFQNTEITANTVSGGTLTIQGSTTNVLLDASGAPQAPPETFDAEGNRIWQWIIDYNVGIYNGITVLGGEKRISDLTIRYRGNGGDDFHMYGTAIAVTNAAKVIIDRCDIQTEGVIATAISAAARADVLVKDCHILTRGTSNRTWYKYNEKGMTSAAWVLAGRGTVRSTNALGASTMTFYQTHGESNGWGVYSGDEAADIHQNIINSTAKIASEGEPGFEAGDFGAGYAVYALSNTHSNVLGCHFDIPDYGIIIAGGWTTHYVGDSSRENLLNLVGQNSLLYQETNGFQDIVPRNTVIDSDHYGFLWHSNCNGTLYILPGTQLHIGDTVFLIKGGEILSNSPKVYVRDTLIDNGGRDTPLTIVHLMESDDAGQTDEIALHHDYKWAICHMSPEKREHLSDAPTAQPSFYFQNETLTGNFYNSVNTAVQRLNLYFDHCTITGEISSGDCEHTDKSYYYGIKNGEKICVDENGRAYQTLREAPYTSRSMGGTSVTRVYVHPVVDPQGNFVYDDTDTDTYERTGYAIYYTDAQYISKTFVTASKTVNNPVAVTLREESTWTVEGICYLDSLTIEKGSHILGRLYVNGKEVQPLPGTYQGDLLLTP